MRKLAILLCTAFFFFTVTSPFVSYAGSKDKSAKKAWKKLKKVKKLIDIKYYMDDADDKVEILERESDRMYCVEMGRIRKALEDAGIKETVIIEIRTLSSLVDRLGTYTPKVEEKDGKTTVSFESIPDTVKIHTNLNQYDKRLEVQKKDKGYAYNEPVRTYRAKTLRLVFKNAKGKIKVRLLAKFLYLQKGRVYQ